MSRSRSPCSAREAELARKVSTLAEQLTVAERRRQELLAMLAHELRNPLHAIAAANRLQDTVGAQDSENVRLRAIVARQTRHMSRIIDDLLDAAHFLRDAAPLQQVVLDLRKVVTRASDSQKLVLRGRDQRVRLRAPDDPVFVVGDELRLEQAVTHLLINASKYSANGAQIEVDLSQRAGVALLCVRDSGVGIPCDMLESIFDMFVQLDSSLDRATGGLGLGLSAVKSIVERHKGSVRALSGGKGQGAQFIVELPSVTGALPSPAPSASPVALGEAWRTSDPLRMGLSVLLVEDNDDTRDLMRALLELRGYRVACAADGPEGIAQGLAQRPDVAVVDIGLPGADGYMVAKRLRGGADPKPVLIAVTGYGSAEDRQLTREAGFDYHLVKPVDSARLFELLRRVSQEMHTRRIRR